MLKFRKIICGISGGVDSAVTALLLKSKGYDVHGVFMRNWDEVNEKGVCTGEKDQEDAEFVCNQLQIPFSQVNFVQQYWNNVFSEMIAGYESGVTPNPDVLCNKHVKFGSFFKHATEELGADAVATGHYARSSFGQYLEHYNPEIGAKLLQSVDSWKDQTLFLAQIPQSSLQRTMFPVGYLNKSRVKEIAAEAGLDRIVKKKESTGICFIGTRNFQDFIEEYIEPKPGNFINIENGQILGRHKGTHYWTVGQRSNLAGHDVAFFIARMDPKTQEIYVAKGTDHPALFTETLTTGPPHWIHRPPNGLVAESTTPTNLQFKFQHIHDPIHCDVQQIGTGLRVTLEKPIRAITKGQYAVFYDGEECLGSAQITTPGPTLYELEQIKDKRTAIL